METYAQVTDLEAEWRPLTGPEKSRAEKLLQMAGVLIRRRVDVNAEESRAIARWVSTDMVLNALAVPMEQRGRTQYAVTAGAVSESATVLNPHATLRLLAGHLELFGLSSTPGPSFGFGWCGEVDPPCKQSRYQW